MADAGERGVTRFLGYGRQSIEQEDIDAVVAALKGDFLTQGPLVPAFEKALAEACGRVDAAQPRQPRPVPPHPPHMP